VVETKKEEEDGLTRGDQLVLLLPHSPEDQQKLFFFF
jgi:hypothetical protein